MARQSVSISGDGSWRISMPASLGGIIPRWVYTVSQRPLRESKLCCQEQLTGSLVPPWLVLFSFQFHFPSLFLVLPQITSQGKPFALKLLSWGLVMGEPHLKHNIPFDLSYLTFKTFWLLCLFVFYWNYLVTLIFYFGFRVQVLSVIFVYVFIFYLVEKNWELG